MKSISAILFAVMFLVFVLLPLFSAIESGLNSTDGFYEIHGS